MEPVEDLRPVALPPGVVELRIHGVSGTPPESLLKRFPIRVSGSGASGFYRSGPREPGDQGVVEAYCWGGLTSGSRLTAAWLLLLPFAFVNVAGWMLPTPRPSEIPPERADPNQAEGESGSKHANETSSGEPRRRRIKLHSFLSRFLALALTMLVSSASYLVAFKGLGASLPWSEGLLGWLADRWTILGEPVHVRLAMAAALAGLIPLTFYLISRSTTSRYEQVGVAREQGLGLENIATPGPGIDDLWNRPSFLYALGVLHLGAAWGVISVESSYIMGTKSLPLFEQVTLPQQLTIGLGLIAILAAATGLMAISAERARVVSASGGIALGAGLVGWILSSVAALHADLAEDPTGGLDDGPASAINGSNAAVARAIEASDFAFAGVIGLALLLILGVVLLHLALPRSGSRFFSAAFAVWGFVAMISAPSGLLLLFDEPSPSINLAAWLFVTTGLVLAVSFLLFWRPLWGGTPRERAVRLRDGVGAATEIVKWSGIGLSAAILAGMVWWLCSGGISGGSLPDPESAWGGVIGWGLVVVLVFVLAGPHWWKVLVGLVVLGAIALVVVDRVQSGDATVSELPSLTSAGQWFLRSAGFLAMLAPLLATAWFIFRASDKHKNRRAVGVFWDLVNYWPRWYHPWAPPPYTEKALPDLEARITGLAADHEKVVVSAHSQGAVIAVPVLKRLPQTLTDSAKIRFLSYGCLLDRHYETLFPRFFNDGTFEEIDRLLNQSWINLYRCTDPLGHPISSLGGRSRRASYSAPVVGRSLLTHSDYQYSFRYHTALAELLVPPVRIEE